MELEEMHNLTSLQTAMLHIRFEDRPGLKAWATYDTFAVGDAASNYQIKVLRYSGTAGDELSVVNGQQFRQQYKHVKFIKEYKYYSFF